MARGKRVSPERRAEILAWKEEHQRGVKFTAQHFGIPRSTLQGWLKSASGEAIRLAARDRRRAKMPTSSTASTTAAPTDEVVHDRHGNAVDWDELADVVRPDIEPNVELVLAPTQIGRHVIGTLTPGCRVSGITKGQVSALDLVRAILDQTGPADVIIATWSTGLRDAETAGWLLRYGAIRTLHLITDHSFRSRKPEYVKRLIELFGDEAITLTRSHAKFVVVQNDEWNVCLRTSANLNRNPRLEQFDLDDNAKLCELYCALAFDLRRKHGQGVEAETADVDAAFEALLGGGKGGEEGAADEEVREALEEWDPSTVSRLDYLIRAVKASARYSSLEYKRGHSAAARSWFELSTKFRADLDELKDAEAARKAASRVLPEPDDLARAILDRLPMLLALAPDQCRRAAVMIADKLVDDTDLQERVATLREELGRPGG